MKKFGKTIKLFLIDGEPNGRMTCELSNWTGKAYKIPRIMIKESYSREDLQSPGIYLLFGENEDGKGLVYIGEAETIIDRLKQHVAQKEFWSEVILFISKDENLNKAHIKYLESRLYEITKKVNHYELENNTVPAKSSISESEIAEMGGEVKNIKIAYAKTPQMLWNMNHQQQIKSGLKENKSRDIDAHWQANWDTKNLYLSFAINDDSIQKGDEIILTLDTTTAEEDLAKEKAQEKLVSEATHTITVNIYKIVQTANPDGWSSGDRDYYAKVKIGNNPIHTIYHPVTGKDINLSPNWKFTDLVNSNREGKQIPIHIELWDSDGGLNGNDDLMVINPINGKKVIDLTYDLD